MLDIKSVTVKFGKLTILRSLSLGVPQKSIVGLVGRNGAGKTTTLKSIMGLVPITSGQVKLDGQDLKPVPPQHRVRLGIGYMPEDRRLIGSLTVQENILLPVWAQGKKKAQDSLEPVYDLLPEIKNVASYRAAQLSGGQQKLVALARSLLVARRLLLLDEPMEGVAYALSARLGEAVQRFQEKEPDLSIFIAESDLNRVKLFTQSIYTIERGALVSED